MNSHTPGPWGWRKFGGHLALVGEHSDTPIVMDFTRKGMQGAQPRFRGDFGILCPVDPTVEGHPDAALIAAAPELLAMLEEYVDGWESQDDDAVRGCAESAHRDAWLAKRELRRRALLSRARGEVKP